MNAHSPTKANTPIRVNHTGAQQTATGEHAEAFDLAGTAYRVVLGCCTQELTIRNTDHSRPTPAKAKPSVRATKEVNS